MTFVNNCDPLEGLDSVFLLTRNAKYKFMDFIRTPTISERSTRDCKCNILRQVNVAILCKRSFHLTFYHQMTYLSTHTVHNTCNIVTLNAIASLNESDYRSLNIMACLPGISFHRNEEGQLFLM